MHLKISAKSKFILLIMLCFTNCNSKAQNTDSVALNIGDPAPPLQVSTWLKGTSFQNFEKGKLYAIEFWATWCKPCIAAMPHLSAFARNHRNQINILAIAVYEAKTPFQKIKKFVDSMGNRMDYSVAIDKNQLMKNNWLKACGDKGIPKIIVINANGKIAWIGHPQFFEQVATKIINHQWDIHQALTERNLNRHLKELADSINRELIDYSELMNDSGNNELINNYNDLTSYANSRKPDTVLFYINKIVQQEPGLKYHALIVYRKFYALLKINMQEALEYGRDALSASPANAPADDIISALKAYPSKHLLPKEMYELGAEAYQLYINQFPYPELVHIPKYYHEMAEWYWLAKNKQKAIEAEENAIHQLKSHPDFTPSALADYKAELKFYKIQFK